MADNTFRCSLFNQDRLWSMKLLPTARMISATSKGGRFISDPPGDSLDEACATVSLCPVRTSRSCQAECRQPSDAAATDAGRWRWPEDRRAPVELAPWESQRRSRSDAWRSCDAAGAG